MELGVCVGVGGWVGGLSYCSHSFKNYPFKFSSLSELCTVIGTVPPLLFGDKFLLSKLITELCWLLLWCLME